MRSNDICNSLTSQQLADASLTRWSLAQELQIQYTRSDKDMFGPKMIAIIKQHVDAQLVASKLVQLQLDRVGIRIWILPPKVHSTRDHKIEFWTNYKIKEGI